MKMQPSMKLLEDLQNYLQHYRGNTKKNKMVVKRLLHFLSLDMEDQMMRKTRIQCLYDQKRLPLKGDIMKHVLGIQHVFEILKHIFIDISRGKVQSLQITIRKAATEDEGKYRIDYSTIPDHVACNNGVKWMTELACKLNDLQELNRKNKLKPPLPPQVLGL